MMRQGVPANWLSYIRVGSAADTARRAASFGGTLLKEAFDGMDIGRMAVIEDPQGAVFAVWKPIRHHGTHFAGGQAGTLCWNELATTDTEAAAQFYTKLFPWESKVDDLGPARDTEFHVAEKPAGGMLQMTAEGEGIPPHWVVYFAVDDCDAGARRERDLGGRIRVAPTEVPRVGRFSVLEDPQGAVFSIIKPSQPG